MDLYVLCSVISGSIILLLDCLEFSKSTFGFWFSKYALFLLFHSCLSISSIFIHVYQENVLAESRMMVPDCRKRLEAALSDLKGTLVSNHV